MYLGIDLGTSSVKIVILNESLQLVAQSCQPLSVSCPYPRWSEQHPEKWWQATCRGMHHLKQQYSHLLSGVTAIGLSGQMHGATLLDAHGHILRPAILWNDGRSSSQCEELVNRVPEAPSIIGSLMMPGLTAPKLLWVQQNEPDVFKQIATVLLPKDYLRYRMSGVFATDMSDASGTAWLAIKKRLWSYDMLAACDLDESQMPELFEGNATTAVIHSQIARQWGVPESTTIAAGAGDNPASAISMNVIQPGKAFLSLGTSGVYFLSCKEAIINPRAGVHTYAHCLPGLWQQTNCHLSAASCLDWFANISHQSIATLMQAVEQDNSLGDELFLPYLAGERSPLNNPYACGVFFGLTHNTNTTTMMRAILEGVAFNFANGQKALDTETIQEVSVVGGGAKNLYWGKILATILRRELYYYTHRNIGAAVGAAKLAWLSTHKADPEHVLSNPHLETSIAPVSEWISPYEVKHQRFNQLYERTSSLMQ